MSATSNKFRMLILVMAAISLVFFVASVVAASVSSEQAPGAADPVQMSEFVNCMVVQTGDNFFVDCSP